MSYNPRKISKAISSLIKNAPSDPSLVEHACEKIYIDPFLRAFGWDFNCTNEVEVQPRTDDGKIADYALKKDGRVCAIMEVKRIGNKKLSGCTDQLKGYFNKFKPDIGILTNGIQYWFFSWTNDMRSGAAYMNETPFAVIDLNTLDLFSKDAFLRYLHHDCFDGTRLKWYSQIDYINGAIYGLLGDRKTHSDITLARKALYKAAKNTNKHGLKGKDLHRRDLKDLYAFTLAHSRWNFTHDKIDGLLK